MVTDPNTLFVYALILTVIGCMSLPMCIWNFFGFLGGMESKDPARFKRGLWMGFVGFVFLAIAIWPVLMTAVWFSPIAAIVPTVLMLLMSPVVFILMVYERLFEGGRS